MYFSTALGTNVTFRTKSLIKRSQFETLRQKKKVKADADCIFIYWGEKKKKHISQGLQTLMTSIYVINGRTPIPSM